MSADGDVSYHGGHYTSRQNLLLGVTSAGLAVSTLAVSLRLIARRYLHVKLWWDDYLAVLTVIMQYFPLITIIIGVRAGLGRHATELSADQGRTIGIMAFVHQLTYVTAFAMVNVQILMLYVRLFPLHGLHQACWILGTFSVVWGITNLIVLLVQCIPIPHFWSPTMKGHCINQNLFYAIATVIPTLNIIAIFCTPIPILWKLKISTSRKWSLAAAFLVGTLACVSAIIRLVLYFTVTHEDQSWTIARSIFWGCLEISAQVVSASLPSMMPLILALLNKERRLLSKYRSRQHRSNQYRDHKYGAGDKGADPKQSQPRKIRDIFSLGSADPLPEGFTVTVDGVMANNDHFDMRLLEPVHRSSERIEVTDKIQPVSKQITGMDESPQASAEVFPSVGETKGNALLNT